MQTPPGGGHNPREAQELEARFSALSAEIAASLDMILTKLQRAPGDEHAIAVARDLVAAQQAINQQLLLLSQADGRLRLAATQTLPKLPAPASRASATSQAPSARTPLPPDLSRQVPRDVVRTAPQYNPAPTARHPDSPTLADLLRHHLAVSAPQPGHDPVWQHNPPYQPRPARPHALELAPITSPATDHVVWTDNVQPQYTGPPPSAPAPGYARPAAEPFAPAPIAVLAAAMPAEAQPGLPSWAQPTVQPRPHRYGLWAGGAVAAVVFGLGMTLHARRHPDATVPLETATIAAADAGEPQPSDEPVTTASVAAEPEAPRMDVAAIAGEATNVESPATASPAPASVPPIAREVPPVPDQGALLPSAQNWIEQNAPPERVTPPAAPKAKAPAARNETRETGALGKSKPESGKKTESAAAPKPPAKKAEVAPFKTAVVKAPQETLFAPVLLELKNADSLMRVFEDLQRRHSALAGKRAEIRPAAGPNNETWFALLAVPAVSKTEAEAICRAMGSEGATLRCRTIKY